MMAPRHLFPRRPALPAVAGLAWLMALVLPLWPTQALADAVVIRSTAPDLKAGQRIATGTSLTLPAGSAVTLVSQDGRTIVLSGPFSGPVTGDSRTGDDHTVTALSRLLTASAADASALGVTRALPEMASRDPYAIAAVDGTHCQVTGRKPFFKRGMSLEGAHLAITAAGGGQAEVDMPAGRDEAAWPGSLSLADKATFQILINKQPKPVQLTVRLVPQDVAPGAPLAAWMADHGCGRQARNLLATLK